MYICVRGFVGNTMAVRSCRRILHKHLRHLWQNMRHYSAKYYSKEHFRRNGRIVALTG